MAGVRQERARLTVIRTCPGADAVHLAGPPVPVWPEFVKVPVVVLDRGHGRVEGDVEVVVEIAAETGVTGEFLLEGPSVRSGCITLTTNGRIPDGPVFGSAARNSLHRRHWLHDGHNRRRAMKYMLMICNDESVILSPAEVHALPQIRAWDAEVDARGIRRGGAAPAEQRCRHRPRPRRRGTGIRWPVRRDQRTNRRLRHHRVREPQRGGPDRRQASGRRHRGHRNQTTVAGVKETTTTQITPL